MNEEIKLTGYAKLIAQVLKCDATTAEQVFSKMCQYDFDFSRSSKQSFNKTAKFALAEVKGA